MMRLIDADKVIELFSPFVSEDKKVVYQPRQLKIDDIKNAPTVEAIPIEWIERWLDRVTGTRDGDDISKYHDLVKGGILFINMLERDWEKENEIN